MDIQPNPDYLRKELALFSGGTGGIDDWLVSDRSHLVYERLARLADEPLSCGQLNQLLALSHQAEVSEGFFQFYWTKAESHPYEVKALPWFHDSYQSVDQILTVDQLRWGLYRLYIDSLLFFGTIQNGFRELKARTYASLVAFFQEKRYPTERMIHRGRSLPLGHISKDDRYLIAEQACKSFEPPDEEEAGLIMTLKGAWAEHAQGLGGKITTRELLEGARLINLSPGRKQQFLFAADEILDSVVESEAELIARYESVRATFNRARETALHNTELYLSMANDLDVYVATSMRSRQQFRDMADTCTVVFSHPSVAHLNLRYFDPTLSAARGHEDKGLIECLMVKCARVLIYTAGDRDSYGKDAEAAMALSLGKPVIFLCDEDGRRKFFGEVHPLSRLINFQTGVAVGAMATSSPEEVALLLRRIFENKMEYRLEQPKKGYFRLRENLTGATVRLQTNDSLLRETFWNCYHRPALG